MNYYVFPGIEKKVQRRYLLGNIDHIINVVCECFNVDAQDVKSKSRKRTFAEPRQIAIYFIRQKTSLSLKKIGLIFSRDHSTVINSIEVVTDSIQVNKRFCKKIEQLESLI
jgi:chromosomal replication initiator protein